MRHNQKEASLPSPLSFGRGIGRIFVRLRYPRIEKWHRQSKDEANMSRAGRIETWVILSIIIAIIAGIILL